MKKLIIALLCVGVQIQAGGSFTLTKVGRKTVTTKSAHGRYNFPSLTLEREGQYVHFQTPNNVLHLVAPKNIEFNFAEIGEDAHSPFTICVVDADADPITVKWYVDRDRALKKQYLAREEALKAEAKKKYEEEVDKQVKARIDAAIKS